VSLKLRVLDTPLEGPTIFTDASSVTGQGAVVWQGPDNEWETRVLVDRTISVQMLEAKAVAVALSLWPETSCNIVTDSAFVTRLLLRMGTEGVPSTTIASLLEEALVTRSAPVVILHVCSHSEVPGFFSIGNAIADKVAGTQVYTLQAARDLHSSLHIGARALAWVCSIPLSSTREVVLACPHCNS
ncbi:POL1 protein, partial [Rhinopomastus cyanomelas]|nr:POL1 protein [Rhinopomastus cyanomelas]